MEAGVVQADNSLGSELVGQLGREFGADMKAVIVGLVSGAPPADGSFRLGSVEP